ncbi:MAG: YdcF family protein [Gemmataceae bacterium]|nr:YdcF family protein [Gemmataceae bacterium]
MIRGHKLRAAALLFLAALLVLWLFPEQLLPPVAGYLNISEPPRQTDYVLVLNGDPQTRPFAAAAIVKAGLAREVLLTPQRRTLESANVQDGNVLSELDLIQRVLQARGVPSTAVQVLPGEIGSTFEEANILAEFLASRPEATVTVVTNGFHTRRARRVFAKVLGDDRAARLHWVGVPRDGVDEATWWRTGHGCSLYAGEYAKLVYYWVRY